MTDIIEQCAEAGNHTLNCPLSDKERDLFARAVIAKFKELTAEPTAEMIAHTKGECGIMKTAIEMARECHIAAYTELTDHGSISQELQRALLSGEYDHYGMHKSALAMHTMRQAEIDELVEGLSIALKSFDELNQGFPEDERIEDFHAPVSLGAKISSLKGARALLTKHRPDAFAKWADRATSGEIMRFGAE